MCFGGASPGPDNSIAIAQAQIQAQQQIASQNADLQQKIADQQAQQSQEALDYQKSQDAQRQAEADTTAQTQAQYDQNRSQLASQYTDWVKQTFAPFNDNYYNQYAKDYVAALQPEVDRQYSQTHGQMVFSLARNGQLNSQAHADLQGSLDQARGRAMADIGTQASQAAQNLKSTVGQQQQSLLQQILTTGALGQPVAPASADEVNAQIDNTNRALQNIQITGADQIAKIGQLPSTSTLGNIFGGVATGVGNFLQGNQAYNLNTIGGAGGSGGAGTGPNAPGIR
jgi:multidrug efflux pump subunit AcrA (membrane-fusion protein)